MDLARILSDMEERLRAVERGSQMGLASVETAEGESLDVADSLANASNAEAVALDVAASVDDARSVADDAQALADDAQIAADAAQARADAAQAAADSVTATVATIPGQIATAKAEALAAAATDAQTKADLAKAQALSGAATDAQTKADLAKAAAIAAAATDATTKANNAQSAATTAAATDASTKASNAQSAAITAAATDAQTKANTAEANAKTYVQSRATDLITNGTGYYGNATNFATSFNFNGADAPTGANGSFVIKTTANQSAMTDEFIAYDPTKPLRFAFQLRQTVAGQGTVNRAYGFIAPFDFAGNSIQPYNYMYVAGTMTTLAADLKAGDTTIKLTSAANWYGATGKPAGASTYLRAIQFWNYTDPAGKTWAPGTYTRNGLLTADQWADGGVDTTTNTITLRAAYTGATIPAGTSVSNMTAGGSYLYMPSCTNVLVPEVWTSYADTFSAGIMDPALQAVAGGGAAQWTTGLPPGTAKIRPGWLLNYPSGGTGKHAVAAVSLSDASAANTQIRSWTKTGTVQIDGGQISADSVTAAQIAAGAVTASEIATDAVTSTKILAGAIVAGKIAANAVTAGTIAADAVTANEIAAGAVTASEIATDAVTATKILAGAVVAGKIAANAVTATEIAADAVTSTKILAGAVIAGKIATDAVTANTIAAGAVVAGKIAADAVLASNIKAGEVQAVHMAAGTITAGSGVVGSLDASKITVGTLDAARIAAGSITASHLSATSIDGKVITGATIRTAASGARWETGATLGGGRLGYVNQIMGYTGVAEEYTPGMLTVSSGLSGGGRATYLTLQGADLQVASGNVPTVTVMANLPSTGTSYTKVELKADRIDLLGDTTIGSVRPLVNSNGNTLTTTGTGLQQWAAGPALAFTAPQSGTVKVTVAGFLRAPADGSSTTMMFEIRTGSTIRAGSVFYAASTSDSVGNYNVQYVRAATPTVVTGLTPGSTYNAYICVNSAATGAVYTQCSIMVEPCL